VTADLNLKLQKPKLSLSYQPIQKGDNVKLTNLDETTSVKPAVSNVRRKIFPLWKQDCSNVPLFHVSLL